MNVRYSSTALPYIARYSCLAAGSFLADVSYSLRSVVAAECVLRVAAYSARSAIRRWLSIASRSFSLAAYHGVPGAYLVASSAAALSAANLSPLASNTLTISWWTTGLAGLSSHGGPIAIRYESIAWSQAWSSVNALPIATQTSRTWASFSRPL